MQRVAVADPRLDPQRPVRLDHVDIDDVAVGQDGEIDRLVEGLQRSTISGCARRAAAAGPCRLSPGAETQPDAVAVPLPVVVQEGRGGEVCR